MPQLPQSLNAWQTADFDQSLKQEITALPAGTLPLHEAVTEGGYVDDSNIEISILSSISSDTTLQIKTGVFFTEIVICCGCGDDPVPKNNYCEMMVRIDKTTASTTFEIISDQT